MQDNIIEIPQSNSDINTKPKIITNKPSQCEVCGAAITWFSRARRLRTKKHKDAIHINHIKFVIN